MGIKTTRRGFEKMPEIIMISNLRTRGGQPQG